MQLHIGLHLSTFQAQPLRKQRSIDILVPRVLLAWLDNGLDQSYLSNLSLVLCERLELLDDAYELSVSVLLHATQMYPVRFVGLTQSLNDTVDLARWLNVPDGESYDFRPRDREQPLSTTSQSFTIPPSPALFKAMVKPAYTALRSLSVSEDSLIFVPSRAQCRTTCNDLITQCAIEMNTQGFLVDDIAADEMKARLFQFRDRSLVEGMMCGIGVLHSGMLPADRLLTMELFADGVLRVLILPREMCWTLPVRASLVIVFGTQYFEVSAFRSVKKENVGELRDYSVHELVRMQGLAVRHGRGGRFHLLCHAEQRDTYMRFLEEGLPLESSLLSLSSPSVKAAVTAGMRLAEKKSDLDLTTWGGSEILKRWFEGRRARASIRGKQDVLDILSHTFLWRRMKSNPTYYDVEDGDSDAALSRIVDRLFERSAPSPSLADVSESSRSIESNPQSAEARASTST
jgi:antiviral helicase SLH1